MELLVEHTAVVVRLNLMAHVVGVEVKAVKIEIELLDRRHGLEHSRSRFQGGALGRGFDARDGHA
jgi:hypothetical protein